MALVSGFDGPFRLAAGDRRWPRQPRCRFAWHPRPDSVPMPIAYSGHPCREVLSGLPTDVPWRLVLLSSSAIAPHPARCCESVHHWRRTGARGSFTFLPCLKSSSSRLSNTGHSNRPVDAGGASLSWDVCAPQQQRLAGAGMGVVLGGASAFAQPRSKLGQYETLLRMAATTVSLPGFSDSRTGASSPWNPANLLFTTDYDCTCTVQDSCELLVWAKEDALKITDRTLMKAYESLCEEYEVILRDHIGAMPVEFEEESGDMDDDAGQGPPSTSYDAGEPLGAELLLKLGLDPKLVAQMSGPARRLDQAALQEPAQCKEGLQNEPHHLSTKALRKALKHLAGLETLMNGKIMAAGFFKGLRREAIRAAGKRVALQHRCLDVLARLTASGNCIHVISANWSRDLIYGGLSQLPEGRLFVHCNDLDFDANGEATGFFQNQVINALDKEAVQQALRRIITPAQQEQRMVVYLGDAQTDLLALLEADLGVVVGERVALRDLLVQHGIQVRPLVEAAALLATDHVSTFRQSGVLFYATGWEDVETCLLERDEHTTSQTDAGAALSEIGMPLGRAIKIAA